MDPQSEHQPEEVFSLKLISGSLMVIFSLITVILALLNLMSFALVGMMILGLIMFFLPYPTPQTEQFLGPEKARIFTKAAGFVLFVAGGIGYFKL